MSYYQEKKCILYCVDFLNYFFNFGSQKTVEDVKFNKKKNKVQ